MYPHKYMYILYLYIDKLFLVVVSLWPAAALCFYLILKFFINFLDINFDN